MVFPEFRYLCGVFRRDYAAKRRRKSLTGFLALALAFAACSRDNATLGPLPRIAYDYLADEVGGEARLLAPAQVDELYTELLPAFGPLRGREVPFAQPAPEIGYRVLGLRLEELRRSCDLSARIRLQLTEAAQCPVRVFYKVTGRRGETLGRGFAVIADPQRPDAELPAGTLLEGITNLRLLDRAAAYRDFGKLVFLSRSDFEAVSAELRDRER